MKGVTTKKTFLYSGAVPMLLMQKAGGGGEETSGDEGTSRGPSPKPIRSYLTAIA
jgi:hypothetical protein